jgi:hypothetical protein
MLPNGLKLYQVKLVNGPANGGVSLCSGDIVWQAGAKYVRGKDDRYYYEPEAGGKN